MTDTASPTTRQLHEAYALAKERYAALDVDTDQALATLGQIALSLHCWQGDDVAGFESPDTELSGGIAATGNYPGKARNADELRRDLDKAYSLIPGTHRLNLHAIYAETGGQKIERNQLQRNTLPPGSSGPKLTATASTSTRPASRTRSPIPASPWPALMHTSASSGSSTASPAARSALLSVKNWARPA